MGQPDRISDSFVGAFAALVRDVRQATGWDMIWKDAEPALWLRLPARISQHQHPYCLGVKAASEANRARCCQADNVDAGAFADQVPVQRRCPFGVVEMAVPIFLGQHYQGCCYLATGRSRRVPRDARSGYTELPLFEPGPAKATARLVQRLVTGIVHPRDPHPPANDLRMRRARQYIDRHLRAGLRASEVALALDLSTSRFVHAFKDGCGESFSSFMQRRLMHRAAQLLVQGGRTVTAVAQELGFHNPAYFSTAFKRFHGASPRSWLAKIRLAEG